MKRLESRFDGFDGSALYFQEWLQDTPAKALILITHGQGEHSDAYNRLIDGIKSSGCHFIAWDWRGHGRSQGKRGYAANFKDYVKDYAQFLKQIFEAPEFASLPILLLGHSMGGLIQLSYLADNPNQNPRIKAQILSSPLLGLNFTVPPLKDAAARLALKLLPELTLHNELKDVQFTRDPEVLAAFRKDPYRHHKMSPGVYLGFLEEIKYVFSQAQELKIPTLMQLSGEDTVVSTPKAEDFFELLGAQIKKKYVYPERLHESYNDLGREEVYQDLLRFIKPYLIS